MKRKKIIPIIILLATLGLIFPSCDNNKKHHSKSGEVNDSDINDTGNNTDNNDDSNSDDIDDGTEPPTYIPKQINPSDYPEMSDEVIGQLRWTLNIADDDIDDFSRIPSLNMFGIPWSGSMNIGFSSYRYSIAFHTYFLASVQYHKIPACMDIIKPRMDRMIQKMQEKAVWKYWASTSTGWFTFPFGPLELGKQVFYKSEHDPVRVKNIMYSGHLAQMITLYEKLYKDLKYSEPGSIVFEWKEDEVYKYDTNTLLKHLRDMFLELPAHCIECEPNICFPESNQHPVLALKVYDQVHQTTYYDDVKDVVMNWFLENNMINEDTHNTASMYLPLTDKTLGPVPSSWNTGNILSIASIPLTYLIQFRLSFALADGWAMSFMHAWQPEYIESHYLYNKENRISSKTGRVLFDETIFKNIPLGTVYEQFGIPLYAVLASEMGDTETRDSVIGQCDDFFAPEWNEDGSYCYPVGRMDLPVNVTSCHSANSGTGALAGIAKVNPKNGLYKLHTDPLPGTGGPVVEGIDISKTDLKRAVYDPETEALIVSTDAGPLSGKNMSEVFKIKQLDPEKIWHLRIDGEEKETYTDVTTITIEVPLDGPHDMVLVAD